MRCFIDLEFTGLHQNTTSISIGLVDENDATLYCEFSDYNRDQVDEWIQTNVVDNLLLGGLNFEQFGWVADQLGGTVVYGNKKNIADAVKRWLAKYDVVEMWGDCVSYDWVVFCELFGGARNIPKNVYYLPFDIVNLFKDRGLDPDINREEYVGVDSALKHVSLWDAKVIKMCYDKLNSKNWEK
jgi:hypothetical protein